MVTSDLHIVLGLTESFVKMSQIPYLFFIMLTTFLVAYQRAFSLSTDAYEKSSILAAIGLVYYSMQDIQTAKSFLFKRYVLSICFEMGAISGKKGL